MLQKINSMCLNSDDLDDPQMLMTIKVITKYRNIKLMITIAEKSKQQKTLQHLIKLHNKKNIIRPQSMSLDFLFPSNNKLFKITMNLIPTLLPWTRSILPPLIMVVISRTQALTITTICFRALWWNLFIKTLSSVVEVIENYLMMSKASIFNIEMKV